MSATVKSIYSRMQSMSKWLLALEEEIAELRIRFTRFKTDTDFEQSWIDRLSERQRRFEERVDKRLQRLESAVGASNLMRASNECSDEFDFAGFIRPFTERLEAKLAKSQAERRDRDRSTNEEQCG
jgi:predicted RNase H-like nuclease (RuvC/YqgF family)